MNISFIYYNYLRDDGHTVSVGGIQTYLSNLIQICHQLDCSVCVIQIAKKAFKIYRDRDLYIGLECSRREFAKKALRHVKSNEIVVFGSDELAKKRYNGYSISIQHGVSWDIPCHVSFGDLLNRLYIFYRAANAFARIGYLNNVNKVVCVDYNFINWYRTQVSHQSIELDVIPNFAECKDVNKKDSPIITIIFARRFHWYRGTTIFIEAITKILDRYDNVEVIIAGEGPDERKLKEAFRNQRNVKFITYTSNNTAFIHGNVDIALVPTVGSEGTSLSLLEAMSSKCAVICTNVGGMTNIVINNYNGIVINPNSSELYNAIEELILNRELREYLSKNAFDTVNKSFSYDRWSYCWKKTFEIAIKSVE